MQANLERFKKELDALVERGRTLTYAMRAECYPDSFKKQIHGAFEDKKKADAFLKSLPAVSMQYQSWYSEAKAVIKQVLPDRLADFTGHYEKPKTRKEITYANYCVADYLQGLTVNRTAGIEKEKIVGPDAAIPQLEQQVAILESAKGRFESSLFDIRQIVQADLLDDELEAASMLNRNGYHRAAGAIAGVVLESHLSQVCANHSISVRKKHPSIGDYNELLKGAAVIDTAQWRFIQHLGDLRNMCDHKTASDPTSDQVDDLLAGVAKITKTLF